MKKGRTHTELPELRCDKQLPELHGFLSTGRNCWAVFRRTASSTNAIFQHDRVSETADVSFQKLLSLNSLLLQYFNTIFLCFCMQGQQKICVLAEKATVYVSAVYYKTRYFGCPKSWQLHIQNYFGTFYFGKFEPHNSNTTYYIN